MQGDKDFLQAEHVQTLAANRDLQVHDLFSNIAYWQAG